MGIRSESLERGRRIDDGAMVGWQRPRLITRCPARCTSVLSHTRLCVDILRSGVNLSLCRG